MYGEGRVAAVEMHGCRDRGWKCAEYCSFGGVVDRFKVRERVKKVVTRVLVRRLEVENRKSKIENR